jgi:putative ABC transport system permease protein
MDVGEAVQSGIESLKAHRLRSALAMLGIIFGVGAVIAMLSIGAGAERQALELIDTMGIRNVIVRAKDPRRDDELQELRKKSLGLAARDAEAILSAVPGVETVAQKVVIEPYKVLAAAGRAKAQVLGVSSSFGRIVPVNLAEGRFLDARDEETFAQACVIGDGVRRDLFAFGPALGRPLKVNEHWLTVVGVLAARAAAGRAVEGVAVSDTANVIYLPVTTAERKFATPPNKSPLDELVVQMQPGASVQEAAAAMDALLDRLHGGAADYALVVPEALLEQSRRTQRIFDIVMGCIAGISLLVGGIGIMNIMLATVLERTREIGVRRAMGARRRDIRKQFLVEAFSISAVGGLLGIGMGIAIAKGVAYSAGWQTVVTLFSIVLAAGVSLAVGLASGLYPAVRAANLDPIEALRYE